MKAAIYARVSTEEQLTGYSIAAQLEACRRLCLERGYSIAAEFVEEGESGKTFAQRPQWQAFMREAQAGAFNVLVTHKIDRFSRATILDALSTLQELKACGVTFTSASEPIDLAQPFGEFMLLSLLYFARHYLMNLSSEVTKGRRKRAESGKSNANRPPFGYRRINGEDMPDESTRHYIVAAFEQYAGGTQSDADIARWLNRNGARTLDNRAFSPMSVRELLINPFYCGYVRYRGIREALTNKRTKRKDTQIIIGTHEPLITRDLWEQAQVVRTARGGKRIGTSSKQHRTYLLQGIAVCASCGVPMRCSCSANGKLRYHCNAGQRGMDCDLSGQSVREEVLLSQIESMIGALHIPDAIIDRAAELLKTSPASDYAQSRRAEIVAEMKRLDYLFQKGRRAQEDYEKEIIKLEAELTLLEPAERVTLEDAGAALASLVDAWRADGSNEGRHEILKALLSAVEVDVTTDRITKWTPRPEFQELFTRLSRWERQDSNL